MASSKFEFPNSSGQQLAAKVDLPSGHPKAFAIFAHCFTCNKNLNAVRNISRALNEEGFGVLRFDFTGLGDSEGEFAETNFSSNVEDLVAAANSLATHYEAPRLLIGHSLGGAAVLYAASKIDSVEAIATIGAPSDPEHVTHLLQSDIAEIESSGEASVNIGGRTFSVKKQFLDDLRDRNPVKVVRDMRKALLIMHSPQDMTVEIKNAANIYTAAHHPKSFISLDGADHLLTNKADSRYAGRVIAGWAGRYISTQEPEKLATKNAVAIRTGKTYTTQIAAGRHQLIGDEPKSVGGADLGPNPYDYLLTALGTCTGMTLRMYADRKKWEMDEVTIHLDHHRNHMEDCEDCEGGVKKVELIKKYISFKGNLDQTQVDRLLEIADRCPVHRTIHHDGLKIETQLALD